MPATYFKSTHEPMSLLPDCRLLSRLLLACVGLLVGCAEAQHTSSHPRAPGDFVQHDAQHRFFDLHWTLERREGRVVVRGIVIASRIDAIEDVTLELVGLDERGEVVSRAFGTTYGGRMSRWQSRPFVIGLRPTGREVRFDVRVWHFEHELGNGANGARG